jgi:hypothetical protein
LAIKGSPFHLGLDLDWCDHFLLLFELQPCGPVQID